MLDPVYVVDKTEQNLRRIERELAWHIYCADNVKDDLEGMPASVRELDEFTLDREIEKLSFEYQAICL